jgi:hypothetical protein
MTTTPDRPGVGTNKARSTAFRIEVLLYIHEHGFTNATTRPETKGLTMSERLKRDTGDIVGLPWTLGVRRYEVLKLGEAQNEVKEEAERAGTSLYASIQHRKDHPVSDAYVTMPLHVFLEVMRSTATQAPSQP